MIVFAKCCALAVLVGMSMMCFVLSNRWKSLETLDHILCLRKFENTVRLSLRQDTQDFFPRTRFAGTATG